MELKDILIRPIITEKSTTALGNDNTYAFEVGLASNKRQVKRAIEITRVIGIGDFDHVCVPILREQPHRSVIPLRPQSLDVAHVVGIHADDQVKILKVPHTELPRPQVREIVSPPRCCL